VRETNEAPPPGIPGVSQRPPGPRNGAECERKNFHSREMQNSEREKFSSTPGERVGNYRGENSGEWQRKSVQANEIPPE